MKTLKYFLLAVCSLLAYNLPATAQMTKAELLAKYPGAAADINNSIEGREFLVAFPPNEADGVALQTRGIEIYVTSRFETEVSLSVPGLGIGPKTKTVTPYSITTFSDDSGDLSWAMEVREDEVVSNKGIVLSAPDPISVWVMTAKQFSSEGYAALPVDTWDREYMHIGYYDYAEPQFNLYRGGGFVIVAQEDETQVAFKLSGTSNGGTTRGGKSINQPYTVSLNRGQTYMVRGNGLDGSFDITGTKITATYPIGLISFHERTILPAAAAGVPPISRDNLCEMIPPISAWGTRHISLELHRENRGDYFRIVASEPETRYEIRYYDKDNEKALIGIKNGALAKAGQWAEFENVNPAQNPSVTSIRGTAIFESEKPTAVMLYAYSAIWDNAENFDPFMTVIPPQRQMLMGQTSTGTPSRAEFNTNWFTILAQAPDDMDANQTPLREVIIDGRRVHQMDPAFLINRIPETNIYWARINVQPGAHTIQSPIPTSHWIYGFSQFESYAWTSGIGTNLLKTSDTTMPGMVAVSDGKTRLTITAEEPNRDDSGLAAIELVRDESVNMTIELDENLSRPGKHESGSVVIAVKDVAQDAHALVIARDRAGNVNHLFFEYSTPSVVLSDSELDFGIVRVGNDGTMTVNAANDGETPTVLEGIILEPSGVFTLTPPALPVTIAPDESISFDVNYAPVEETAVNLALPDRAKVRLILSGGFELEVDLAGYGGLPHLRTTVYPFAIIKAGESNCNNLALKLSNIGTYEMIISEISAIDDLQSPFEYRGPDPGLPLTLAANATLNFGPICFSPQMEGMYSEDVRLETDDPDNPTTTVKLEATADPASSVAENADAAQYISTMPTPASDRVTLRFPAAETNVPVQIVVYDLHGRLVLQQHTTTSDTGGFKDIALDLRGLATGQYFFTLTQGAQTHTGQFSVLR